MTGEQPTGPLPGSAFEEQAAEACRSFHTTVGPTSGEQRRALADFAAEFLEGRLGLSPSASRRRTLERLVEPESLALEVAHDGQLPHLGVVRMVLKTLDVCQADGRGVVLYLVGNHYSADMRPDNLHFGIPLRGRPPHNVKHPPKLRIGRANAHRPFRLLPPPTEDELDDLRDQLAQFVGHNVAHERKSGRSVSDQAKRDIMERLRGRFDDLADAARVVTSLGDWLIRVQWDLLREMLGDEADDIVILPMAEVTELFRGHLGTVARMADRVADAWRSERPSGSPDKLFWVYCPRCSRRRHASWRPGVPLRSSCPSCGRETVQEQPVFGVDLMPDIVAWELGFLRLGIDGWVVGSHASYLPVIEKAYRGIYGGAPPPNFVLTSVPSFRGIGDPPQGFEKTRLLRALLEVSPAALARALRAPWQEDPRITSEFLHDAIPPQEMATSPRA